MVGKLRETCDFDLRIGKVVCNAVWVMKIKILSVQCNTGSKFKNKDLAHVVTATMQLFVIVFQPLCQL